MVAVENSRTDRLEPPQAEEIAAWEEEHMAEALDGCWCKPNGYCEHESPSWLLMYAPAFVYYQDLMYRNVYYDIPL